MVKLLNAYQLSQISPLISAKMGLYFPEARWRDLERGLVAAAAACGFADGYHYGESLIASSLTPSQIDELSAHLTIGETYFFREKPTFNALRESILPELIRSRRGSTQQLRLWSAGCCTGEEAYSVAILLSQLLPDLSEWMLTILGTDINPQFLHKAVAGVYGDWSFRDIPPNIKERYFTQVAPARFELLPAIKQQVKFSALNLADDSYPSPLTNTNAMDVIFCRNVLMYFSPEQAKKVVRNLYNSLTEGGWLVASLGEASHLLFADFQMVQFPNAILYQKRRSQAAHHTIPEPAYSWRTHEHAYKTHEVAPLAPVAPLYQSKVVSKPLPVDELSVAPLPETSPPKPKSQLLIDQDRLVEAEAQVHVELAERPEDAATLIVMAQLCANQGRLGEAVEWCKRALRADRLNARGYYLCATIHEARGEIDEAIHYLKQAIYLHPEFVLAHFALGYLTRQQGKQREADKHFANTLGLLQHYQSDEILSESEGWTAGRLIEMVRAASISEKMSMKLSGDL